MGKRSEAGEYSRRMRNWAMWRQGGADAFKRTWSPIYELGPKPPRAASVMPVLAGEAEDTDAAVRSLDAKLQRLAVLWYVRRLTVDHMRRAMRCRRERLHELLEELRAQVLAYLDERQRIYQRRRDALAGGVLMPEAGGRAPGGMPGAATPKNGRNSALDSGARN